MQSFVENNEKTYIVTSIAYQGFSNFWSLTKDDLPSSIRVIEYEAFARIGLEYDEFYLPENTETMDSYIFWCTQIKRLIINKKLASIFRNTIVESFEDKCSCSFDIQLALVLEWTNKIAINKNSYIEYHYQSGFFLIRSKRKLIFIGE